MVGKTEALWEGKMYASLNPGPLQLLFLVELWSLLDFRVWDKVISGSCKILVFVALEILLSYKIMLMGINRPEGVVKFLCNVSM